MHFLPMLADRGFVPLVRYRNSLELLFIVRKDSGISNVDGLRGRRIGLPDRLSLYHIVGMQWLRSLAGRLGGDYLLSVQPSHTASLLAVDAGRIDAAISARPPWSLLNADVRERLRLIKTGHPAMPSLTTLADGGLGAELIERIRAAFDAFPQSPEGKRYFADSGYGGYVPATMDDVEDARHYEEQVYELMSGAADAERPR